MDKVKLRGCLKTSSCGRNLGYNRGMNPRLPYPTDLTDHEWALLEPYVPHAKRGGRPEHYPKREILNGIFYIVRGGYCPMTSRRGRLSITTFGSGVKTGPGHSCTIYCGAMCGRPRANGANPARGSSTANRSRPPKKGDPRL